MEILSLKVKRPFRYLWLKSVVDVDLNNHCAKCLIGEYNDKINGHEKEFLNILLEDKIHYLCGVAYPFNYDDNFHLAFKPSKNNILKISDKGIDIEINNAKALPISTEYIDNNHPKSNFKSYYTCRNWQFANYFNDYLK